MKRVFPVLLVLFFVFAISFAQDGKPNMVIEKEVYDAGVVVRPGPAIEHAFVIKNSGKGELRILDVKPG